MNPSRSSKNSHLSGRPAAHDPSAAGNIPGALAVGGAPAAAGPGGLWDRPPTPAAHSHSRPQCHRRPRRRNTKPSAYTRTYTVPSHTSLTTPPSLSVRLPGSRGTQGTRAASGADRPEMNELGTILSLSNTRKKHRFKMWELLVHDKSN